MCPFSFQSMDFVGGGEDGQVPRAKGHGGGESSRGALRANRAPQKSREGPSGERSPNTEACSQGGAEGVSVEVGGCYRAHLPVPQDRVGIKGQEG